MKLHIQYRKKSEKPEEQELLNMITTSREVLLHVKMLESTGFEVLAIY